jgi:hypothetical protein
MKHGTTQKRTGRKWQHCYAQARTCIRCIASTTRYRCGMRRFEELAPCAPTHETVTTSFTSTKPEYTPAFCYPKKTQNYTPDAYTGRTGQTRYASYVSVRRTDTKGWHVYLCEREECAHAKIHVCTLPTPTHSRHRSPCAKCGTEKNLTWHHIYPQRFFKYTRRTHTKISLCRTCHDSIERYIPARTVLTEHVYLSITQQFLQA